MDFLNPALLGGITLAGLPIVLHLVMRQKPRHLEFPALRFLRLRQESNQRRMRLRHLLLLALRVAALCLLALALARPSIKTSGTIGDREAPAAAAMVFDTSPRMQYRHDNKTRLEVAQDTCLWLLPQLPAESQVAVIDSGPAESVFQVDLTAARQRVSRLEALGVGRPLIDSIVSAAELLKDAPQERKEIYVFTDLAKEAWKTQSAAALQQHIKALGQVGVYLIDVGVDKPQNFTLGEIQLSGQLLARNSPLNVQSDVSVVGTGGPRVVELYMLDAQGHPQKRSEMTVQADAGGPLGVDFPVGGLDVGTHQGYVRIVGEDGLPIDDMRYFTVNVQPPWKLLIVAAAPAEYRAANLTEALAPSDFRKTGQARFEFDVVPFTKLADQKLESYSAVCLLDPPLLNEGTWKQLADYAKAGGGLALFLGPNSDVNDLNTAAAQELLPGILSMGARRLEGDLALSTSNDQHPMLAKFRPLRGTMPWEDFPVYRYWQFDKLADGVTTIVSFTNDRPALVERPLGRGRVLTFATTISELPEVPDAQRWNQLWGVGAWPFFTLTNEMMLYLCGSTDGQLNYTAGQAAVLRLEAARRFPTYLLSTPRGDQQRLPADEDRGVMIVTATDTPGNYRLRAGGASDGVDRGFSVNLPMSDSQLERIDQEQLKEAMGDIDFRVATNREQIDRDVSLSRVGRQLFPFLIALVALALGVEHVLANRFYRDK